MTYTQAKLIIWNSSAYPKTQVRAAAALILGSIKAQREDVHQAALVL